MSFLIQCLQLALLVEVQGLGTGGEGLYWGVSYLALAEGELGVLVDEGSHDVEVVVGVLSAIDDRATLDAHPEPVVRLTSDWWSLLRSTISS